MTFSCKLDMCTLVQICIFGFDQLTIDDKSKNLFCCCWVSELNCLRMLSNCKLTG